MEYLEIKAPAKINIGLFVTSKRSDGYHNIETVFFPLHDLYDELFFNKSNQSEFKCDKPELENENNLIIKAKELLELQTGKKLNVSIELHKNIPTGAGLGGGSSDAATTLVSLNEMFKLGFTLDILRKFGLILGSDVPFFIKPRPSFAEGRGEILTLLENFDIPFYVLIINPGIHISTKLAYENIKPKDSKYNLRTLQKTIWEDIPSAIRYITNDFEEYVFNSYPEIEQIKEKLYLAGSKFTLMSGSGSTIYGIFDNFEKANLACNHLPAHYFKFISNQTED